MGAVYILAVFHYYYYSRTLMDLWIVSALLWLVHSTSVAVCWPSVAMMAELSSGTSWLAALQKSSQHMFILSAHSGSKLVSFSRNQLILYSPLSSGLLIFYKVLLVSHWCLDLLPSCQTMSLGLGLYKRCSCPPIFLVLCSSQLEP